MSVWTIGWIVWGVLAGGFFLIWEIAALVSRQPNAHLSGHLWRWFGFTEQTVWAQARRIMALLFLVWLLAHVISRGYF